MQFIEKMPRIAPSAPVQESATIYDAFLAKERKREAAAAANQGSRTVTKDTGKSQNGVAGKKSSQAKKKKPENDPKKTFTLEEAIAKVKANELESILAQCQISFPDNQAVWLKDLASSINVKLEKVEETDPVFKDKPKDFPLCKLDNASRKVLSRVLNDCSSQTLEHLFYHSVTMMLSEQAKGNSTYGYRIFLQLLAHQKPDVLVNKLDQYFELMKTNQNKPIRCLSIVWALGQCGTKNLKFGLRVWLNIMMPALSIRSVAAYSVEYLEDLFSLHKNLSAGYGEVTAKDYFYIMDLLFGGAISNFQGDLKKRLLTIYPKLKILAFGSNPPTSMRSFFPSYLTRAKPTCSASMKTEVLSCLETCLMKDPHSFGVWCQMYTKHLLQSSVLLQHLLDNWEQIGKKLDRKPLKETLRSFSVTNEEIMAQGRGSLEGFAECSQICKELLQKMTQSGFSWFWVFFLLLSIVSAIVAYDMYISSSIKASRTMRFLEDYGVLAFLEQVWGRIYTYGAKAFGWLQFNVPFYYGKVCESVGPFLQLIWTKTVDGVVFLEEVTRPHRVWIYAKIVQFINWVYLLSPDLWDQMERYLWWSWGFVKDILLQLWRNLTTLWMVLYSWIKKNILEGNLSTEPLQRALTSTVSLLQNYTASLIQWCGHIFTSRAE